MAITIIRKDKDGKQQEVTRRDGKWEEKTFATYMLYAGPPHPDQGKEQEPGRPGRIVKKKIKPPEGAEAFEDAILFPLGQFPVMPVDGMKKFFVKMYAPSWYEIEMVLPPARHDESVAGQHPHPRIYLRSPSNFRFESKIDRTVEVNYRLIMLPAKYTEVPKQVWQHVMHIAPPKAALIESLHTATV